MTEATSNRPTLLECSEAIRLALLDEDSTRRALAQGLAVGLWSATGMFEIIYQELIEDTNAFDSWQDIDRDRYEFALKRHGPEAVQAVWRQKRDL